MGTGRTNKIDEAASRWLIRRDSGHWSEADQSCFEEWLDESALNRVAYLRLELAWEDAARLKALAAGVRTDLPPPSETWTLTPFFEPRTAAYSSRLEPEPEELKESSPQMLALEETVRSADNSEYRSVADSGHRKRFAVAATLLFGVGAAAYWWFLPGGEGYSTPVGGISSIPMNDGSKVTLNTDSQIRVALTHSERRVDLRHGEAFFEVSKDPQRPFVVRAGNKRVIAVGTKFAVRREGEDIEILVTEGKVRVEDAGETLLTPGNIARAGDSGVLVQRKTLPEAEEQLSWRVGVLVFHDQPLAAVIAEFNRYNARKIVINDPAVGSLRIEGTLRATNVEGFVRLLESGFPVRAAVEQNRIILESK